MPKIKKPDYPTELTVKYWDKKKGLLARVSKIKTGITDELTKTFKLFEAVPWARLDLTLFTPHKADKQQIDDALKEFQKETSTSINAAYKGMRALENFLEKKAEDFKADPKTKEFAADAKKMADAARVFSFAIAPGTLSEPITQEYKLYMLAIKNRAEVLANSSKTFKKYVLASLTDTEKAIKSGKMTSSQYTEHWSENLRGIGTVAKLLMAEYPELKAPIAVAAKLWAQAALPKTDEEVPTQLSKDLVILKKYKVVADKLP